MAVEGAGAEAGVGTREDSTRSVGLGKSSRLLSYPKRDLRGEAVGRVVVAGSRSVYTAPQDSYL